MSPNECGPFKPSFKRLVAISILLLFLPYSYTGGMPVKAFPHANVPLATPAPVLRQGDIWHYNLTIEGSSNESIRRTVRCGNTHCIVDNEVNIGFNDTRWIVPGNWSLVREYCVGCDGFNVITNTTYNPPRQLFAFPLQTGQSWWWNGTVSGRTSAANMNFSKPVSLLRKVINETSVTVHAGTFDTFLVAEYNQSGIVPDEYSWFSLEAETSVKAVSLDSTGGIIDSRELISYRIVGVSPGEFVRLGDISVDYESNDTTPGLAGSTLTGVDSIQANIQNVTGASVTLEIVSNFKNGTQSIITNTTNLSSGSPPPASPGPFVIDAGLRRGNNILNWQGMSINYTRLLSYLGTLREVSVLNVTQTLQPPYTGWVRTVRFWDRATGFLLATRTDTNSTYVSNGYTYSTLESISARIVSTNLWQGFIPGVESGDWAKYGDFSASWVSNIPGDQNSLASYQDTYWQTNKILSASDNNVSLQSTIVFSNATGSKNYEISGNLQTRNGNLTSVCPLSCTLAGNLRAGDPIFDPVYSPAAPTINQTLNRVYLGVHRRVNILNLTSTFSGYLTGSSSSVAIYDQATGILLEYSYQNAATLQGYSRTASAHFRISETNLWNATRLPDFSLRSRPSLLAIQPGFSGTSIVTLSSLHGFADTVSLSATLSPSGPTMGPVPKTLTVTAGPDYMSTSFPLTVSAAADTPAGGFNVTITATNGSLTHETIFTVLVVRPIQIECGRRDLCYIITNVTISNIKSGANTIHFTAEGPHGITGYANLTIPLTSLPSIDNLQIIVDKGQLPRAGFETTMDLTGRSYLVYFTFIVHGPVNVDINLGSSASQPASALQFIKLDPTSMGILGILILVIASLGFEAARKVRASRRGQSSSARRGAGGRKPRWLPTQK